jgi:hypothetical protein
MMSPGAGKKNRHCNLDEIYNFAAHPRIYFFPEVSVLAKHRATLATGPVLADRT